MPGGYTGEILCIDLTKGTIKEEALQMQTRFLNRPIWNYSVTSKIRGRYMLRGLRFISC